MTQDVEVTVQCFFGQAVIRALTIPAAIKEARKFIKFAKDERAKHVKEENDFLNQ